MSVLPSGEQWTIEAGGYEATVVSVGGGLRGLTYDGRPVLLGYGEDEPAHAGIGQHMFPWPNRITDGKYSFEDIDQQLYLTEPARQNAIHGLTRWANWSRVDGDAASVEAGHRLHGQPGYPHQLDLRLGYRLSDDGLTVTATATNVGSSDAPYGYGTHPYLSVGRVIDECVLEFSAAEWLEVSPERMMPIGLAPVDGSPYDFRSGRAIGGLEIDNTFTGLGGGSWSVTLSDPDSGARAVLSSDTPWLQLYTGAAIGRTALAVEPMTCPPNAFITGQNLVVLKPGESHTTTFRVSA
ncbi:aldose 1-epimerase family protein [Kribbella sp. NPDC026596]|uniref:aldose 1-epimerase family protein n=1 Tax=Kribbella sp. NPDC026596 TaxID=3155122 RepID=UPI0033EBDF0B